MYDAIADGNKIARKYMAHYLDAAIPPETGTLTPEYVRLGKDLEEYNAELSATVDKKQNILGETSVTLSSYEKQGTVEPYYAEKNTPMFLRLRDIVDNMKVLDDCNSTMVDVHLWEDATDTTKFPAIQWAVVIEVTGDGGDNTGLQMPFNVHYTGEHVTGVFDVATRTFTPGA